MLFIKRKIRKFSLWLGRKTNEWVIPTDIWIKINNKTNVEKDLIKQSEKFPNDPEIGKARVLITRLKIIGK